MWLHVTRQHDSHGALSTQTACAVLEAAQAGDGLFARRRSVAAIRGSVFSRSCDRVQESVHDEFSKILTEQAKQIQVGNGMDENTTMGPCINAKQRDWAQETVQDAVDQGAEVRALHRSFALQLATTQQLTPRPRRVLPRCAVAHCTQRAAAMGLRDVCRCCVVARFPTAWTRVSSTALRCWARRPRT